MNKSVKLIGMTLAFASLPINIAQAKVKEIQLQPTTIMQQLAERARAKELGSCSPNQIIGSLPKGEEWQADLHKSALLGYHEEGFNLSTSFWARFKCQQPRWDVMQFRVAVSFPLKDLPPGDRPFLAYLNFEPANPTDIRKQLPLLPPISPAEPPSGKSQPPQRVMGISLDSSKGLLCMKPGSPTGHALQHRYVFYKESSGVTEQCGNGLFTATQGSLASVQLNSAGKYWADVTPLLKAARQNQQSTARLVIHGLPAPTGNSNWPTQSQSQLMALQGWKLVIVSDECNWNTFPGSCKP